MEHEMILTHLVNDTIAFKESCDTSVYSSGLVEALARIDAQGRALIRNIETLVEHADGLRSRMKDGGT